MTTERPTHTPAIIATAGHWWPNLLNVLRLLAIVWLLLVGLWSGPAYGSTLIYPNGLLLVEVGLVVVLILQALHRDVRPPGDYPFFWPSLAVLALCGISAVLRVVLRDTHPSAEMLRLWQTGEPMLRGLLLYLAIAGQPRLIPVAWVSLLGGLAVQAGASIVQHVTHVTRWYAFLDAGWATGVTPTAGPRAQGLTAYINFTAAIFATALPIWTLPAAMLHSLRPVTRILLALGGLATLAGLWYTGSRGPMLAVLVAGMLLLWRLSPRWGIGALLAIAAFLLSAWPATAWWALTTLGLAIGLVFVALRPPYRFFLPVALGLGLAGGLQVVDAYMLHYELGWRVSERGLEDTARTTLWRESLQLWKTSPLWGVGDVAFAHSISTSSYQGLRNLPNTQRNAHNQFVHWIAAEGLPVALVFTALVLWSVFWLWREACRWTTPFARTLGLATAVGLTIFLITNLGEAHFWRLEGAAFFWSLLAVATAIGRTSGTPLPD